MTAEKHSKPTPEQIVAEALNEQGFLLQHKIIDVLHSPGAGEQHLHKWKIEAPEVPVALPNGEETRIDLVLRPGAGGPRWWHVVMECKRSARDYKSWIFFGSAQGQRGPFPDCYLVETANAVGAHVPGGAMPMDHRVQQFPVSQDCLIFDYGVEARLNRPAGDKRLSATTAIEDACQQVTLGQAGLALRLKAAKEREFRLFPVVVTTAELMSVRFANSNVSLDGGTIEAKNITVEPRSWLGINYRISDAIYRFSGITTSRNTELATDIAARQIRTVFIVQSGQIHQFLAWLERAYL